VTDGAPAASLAAMYQETILRHYRTPQHKRALPGATARGERKNPLCGDEVAIALVVDGDRITDAAFTGRCCSIAQASASMLTGRVRGETRDGAAQWLRTVDDLLHGRGTPVDDARLGDLTALRGVVPFPARVACALLPWLALRDALASGRDGAAPLPPDPATVAS
jgi:nitrogen fixation NifU-like protein